MCSELLLKITGHLHMYCIVRFQKKKTYSPHRRNWNLLGWGFYETKKLKKCMKLNWNFQRGGEVLEKIPSVGEVWIFSVLHIITFFEKLMYKCSSELPIFVSPGFFLHTIMVSLVIILSKTNLGYKRCHTSCKGCSICNTKKFKREKNYSHVTFIMYAWEIIVFLNVAIKERPVDV